VPDYITAGGSSPGTYGGYGGEVSWVDTVLRGIGSVVGGYVGGIGPTPSYLQQPMGTETDYPGYDLSPGDPVQRVFWRPGGGTGERAVAAIPIFSPSGRLGVWKYMGRPILFSGDLAAARRVQRVASRASRFGGRRRGGR